jgi:Helix-turn-helix domain
VSTSSVRPQQAENNPVPIGDVLKRIPRGPLPYAAIPHAIVNDTRLIPTDIRLVGVLLGYAKSKSDCWPSVDTLARDLGMCRRTVQLSLRRLKAYGWVEERPAGNPTGRVIVLTWRGAQSVAPGGAQPYSQGLPRPRAQSVAPQGMDSEKEKVVPPKPKETEAPRDPSVLFESWLAYPEGHVLRRLALERIAGS